MGLDDGASIEQIQAERPTPALPKPPETPPVLAQDVLTNTIAFKNRSAEYVADVITQIKTLSRQGLLYPPDFPSFIEPELKQGVRLVPNYGTDSYISPAEAVAMQIIASECSAILQISP